MRISLNQASMATSYESGRTSAYSEDLKWRIVWQSDALGLKQRDIAANLGVDSATVCQTLARFRESGTVSKKNHPVPRVFKKLTAPLELTILHLVLERPGIYLQEIASEFLDVMGAEISLSTICRFLRKVGFTRQRLRLAALQRDDFLRSKFVSEVSIYNRDSLIFLDETGSDKRNFIRKYGYSLRGRPMVCRKLLVRGKRVSAIAFMSTNGLLDCKTFTGSVDGEVFYNFVQAALLPHLMPFNGRNPHRVVVMDNCSIHHVEATVKMIQEVGALVLFLPPYSPDYNPIKELFSKVKLLLKTMDKEADVSDDIDSLVLGAFSMITPDDCQQWINHANIY